MKRMMVLLVLFLTVAGCMAQTIRICTKLPNIKDSICLTKACDGKPGCDAKSIITTLNIALKPKPGDSLSNPKANPGNLYKVLEMLLPKVDIAIVNGKGNKKSLSVISKIDKVQIYENAFETGGNGLQKISPKKQVTPIKNSESYTAKIDKNNIGKAAKAAFDQLSFELIE